MKPNLVKFFVIEYTQEVFGPDETKEIALYRLFDFDKAQDEAQKFCAELKAAGVAVNIRTRHIDTNLFL